MVVHYSSIPIVVAFSHTAPVRGERRICSCEIKIGKTAEKHAGLLLGRGESICLPQDNYCKATGRKKSLARAMKVAIAKLTEIGEPVNSKLIAEFLRELHSICKIER